MTRGAQPCSTTRAVTAVRIPAPRHASPGSWSGTDASGGTVTFKVPDARGPAFLVPAVSLIRGMAVRGPFWCGTDGRTDYPAPPGGWHDAPTAMMAIGIGLADGQFAGGGAWGSPPQDGALTTRTFSVSGTLTGTATAEGTWHLTQADASGAIICDSGLVAWQAAPVAPAAPHA